MRRALMIGALSFATIGIGSSAASADPAPPGHAEATVVEIEGILEISGTEANAGPSGGDADATVLGLGGNQVIGSSQEGNGTSEDALFDTGVTPLGRVVIAPSRASVESDGDSTESSARTALLDVTVVDENTVSLTVAESISEATWTELLSTAHAETTLLRLGLFGELEIAVLHSETDGSNSGSYLARINDTIIFSSDQVDGRCLIEIPQVLRLDCLTASGGPGGPGISGSAAGALFDVLSGGVTGGVTSVMSESGRGEADDVSTEKERSRPTAPDEGALPRTGFELMGLTALAVGLIGGGVALLRRRRAPYLVTS